MKSVVKSLREERKNIDKKPILPTKEKKQSKSVKKNKSDNNKGEK